MFPADPRCRMSPACCQSVAITRRPGRRPALSRWHRFATVALLALWLPALHHCRLEQLPTLGFLPCTPHTVATAPEAPAPGTDTPCEPECDDDGCALVEQGFFKLEDAPLGLEAPPAAPAWMHPGPTLLAPSPTFPLTRVAAGLSPPPCPGSHLVLRAAGSPRAPALPA